MICLLKTEHVSILYEVFWDFNVSKMIKKTGKSEIEVI